MYSRFKALKGYSQEELDRLHEATVAVVGLGATGSVIAEHLARHGVRLLLIDRDYLEGNDLYSSNLYTKSDVDNGLPKAIAASEKLSELTTVESHVASLNGGNVDLLESADIILDGTDNLETRFLVNEYCKKNDKPWVYTAAIGEQGYSMFFDSECFSCVFEKVNAGKLDTCESAGIMRETAAISASKSALKAVRYLTGKDVSEALETVDGRLLDVESQGCPVCNGEGYPHLESGKTTTSVCGENKYQLKRNVDDSAFERLREHGEVLADNDYLTRADIGGSSFTLFRSGRAIIEAEDAGHAEAVFDEIIGR